jgi:hypothetical protein
VPDKHGNKVLNLFGSPITFYENDYFFESNFSCVEQGPGGKESPMPPLYTRPDCEDVVKNVLYRLEDCVQTGNHGCILTSYISNLGTLLSDLGGNN